MTTIRSLAVFLAASLATTAAVAAPSLRSEIVVVDQIVTVGDMFEGAGAYADKALFRAPMPGTTGEVDIEAVRIAATRAGLYQFDLNGLSKVTVSRASSVVDAALLSQLILDDLRQRGIVTGDVKATVFFTDALGPLKTAYSESPARLEQLRYLPGTDSFSARFRIAGIERPVEFHGKIDLTIDVPHLAASLPAGTVLHPEHFVMRPLPLAQADALGVPRIEQLVGMALNRPSREGVLIKSSDVSTPLAVAKNDLVTIYYRQGPMTLTVKGQAITGGAAGNNVQILNLMSKRVITATAISPGAVEVTAAPLTVAGL